MALRSDVNINPTFQGQVAQYIAPMALRSDVNINPTFQEQAHAAAQAT